jgi:hypothetical protein
VARNEKINKKEKLQKKWKSKKIKEREATLNISNNNPGILVAEKNKQKIKSVFCQKCPGFGCLTIRNVVLAPKWRQARFFRLLMHCARVISSTMSFQLKRPPGQIWCFHVLHCWRTFTYIYLKRCFPCLLLEFRHFKFVPKHGRHENTMQIKFIYDRHSSVECLPCCIPRCLALFINRLRRTQQINISGARAAALRSTVTECTPCANSNVCSRLETSLASKK